jgi:D-lactate dehydrogenase
MKVLIYSAHRFERNFLSAANQRGHEFNFLEASLSPYTVHLAKGYDAISVFVNDDASSSIIEILHALGVKFILLRSAGFNHVDFKRAGELGMRVARVPAYSPYAVAEHAVTLMLSLNRNIIKAHNRVMDLNFSLDGLTGFDMRGKTVGIIGTGKIGAVVCEILNGFGCRLLAYDVFENEELKKLLKVTYVPLETLCQQSDIISLHCPLNEDTHYLINEDRIQLMKPGVMLINTSRGGLVKTKDVIEALKTGKVGYFGIDVYEEEEHLFFVDRSEEILLDEAIARLLTFRNVLITGHQAFLTKEALENIATTTVFNMDCFENREVCPNELF